MRAPLSVVLLVKNEEDRLAPALESVAFADEVVVVDNSLAAPFAKLLPHLATVRHVIVNGPVLVTVAPAGNVAVAPVPLVPPVTL